MIFTNALKKIAIIGIKGLLWLIDSDHRIKEEIGMDDVKKFTHIQEHQFQSDFGTVSRVFRTVPYEVWELKTDTKTLYAADKHRVIKDDHTCVWIEDLKEGDLIKTDNGIEKVIISRSLNIRTHMYCMQVDTNDENDPYNHLYYSDGILSHNTTCSGIYLLWQAMFRPDTTILIVANKYIQALEIMDRIRFTYEQLPNYIRAGIIEYNKGTIAFDNGSKIVSRATSADSGRGLSVTTLFSDEFAHVQPNKAKEFWTSIQPTLSTGGSAIIMTTPKNDEDQFAQIWKGAIDNTDEYGNPINNGIGKNGFYAIEVPWWEHPERDEEWAKPFRESLGEARFRQEFECQFLSDDPTLIDPLCLARLKGKVPEFYTRTVRWFSDPQPNHTYLVSLDPSMGTNGDYSAIQVFELPGMKQVAEWQHNKTIPRDQVRILMQVLLYIESVLLEHPEQINDPEIFWTIENNTLGDTTLHIIEDTGEDRFPGTFVSEPRRNTGGSRIRKGLTTNNSNKLNACSRLKSLVESDRMIINSTMLLKQLKTFVSSGAGYAGKIGEHDDLVMATVLCVRLLDIVAKWGVELGDLNEYISDGELFEDEPMPMVF